VIAGATCSVRSRRERRAGRAVRCVRCWRYLELARPRRPGTAAVRARSGRLGVGGRALGRGVGGRGSTTRPGGAGHRLLARTARSGAWARGGRTAGPRGACRAPAWQSAAGVAGPANCGWVRRWRRHPARLAAGAGGPLARCENLQPGTVLPWCRISTTRQDALGSTAPNRPAQRSERPSRAVSAAIHARSPARSAVPVVEIHNGTAAALSDGRAGGVATSLPSRSSPDPPQAPRGHRTRHDLRQRRLSHAERSLVRTIAENRAPGCAREPRHGQEDR
jgi:hypothetical protein